jgi:N-acetylglucosaminyldiphosphoundecaprenol N-acetyl-beta-D-mannosaminyltransferase
MPVTLFLSPSTLVRSREEILCMAPRAQVFCDSTTLHLLLRMRGVRIPLAAFDLGGEIGMAAAVLEAASSAGRRVLSVGGSPTEAAAFRRYLIEERGLSPESVLALHGYHSEPAEAVAGAIRSFQPNDVLLGLGAPLQECVARRCSELFPDVQFFTCGGFITQTALAGGKFYPAIFDRLHLRWSYRLLRQPYVLRRVVFEYLPGYVLALRLGRRLCGQNC